MAEEDEAEVGQRRAAQAIPAAAQEHDARIEVAGKGRILRTAAA